MKMLCRNPSRWQTRPPSRSRWQVRSFLNDKTPSDGRLVIQSRILPTAQLRAHLGAAADDVAANAPFLIGMGVQRRRNPCMDSALRSIAQAHTTCHATLNLLHKLERPTKVGIKITAVIRLLDQIGEIMSILDWLGAQHERPALSQ